MDVELKRKWVEALRSGEYKQGVGYLRDDENHFCCLGVLCDISREGTWKEDNDGWNFKVKDKSSRSMDTELTDEFADKIELDLDDMNTLIGMNDGDGRPAEPFSKIANYIETNL